VRFLISLQHHETKKQIFEKCWVYGKDFFRIFACFVDVEKRMTGSLEISFGGFCGNMVEMVSCCLPLRLFTANRCINGKQTKSSVHVSSLVSSKGGCIMFPLLFITYGSYMN